MARASRTDALLAAALAGAALLLYAVLALRLADGAYSDYWNLAFDYDPQKYVDLLAGPMDWRGDAKHPLYALLRPLAWPLVAAGVPAKPAAGLLMAGFAAGSVALVFAALRTLGGTPGVAAILAAAYALSGSQLHLAMIPESYGPAMTGLLAVWLLAIRQVRGAVDAPGWSIAAAVFSMGITLTNVVQPGLVRLALAIRQRRVAGLIRWSIAVLAIWAVLGALVWHDVVLALLRDPVRAVKEVYWLRAAVSTKEGLTSLVPAFAAWSFVAPAPVVVPIAGGIGMWDFRASLYSPLGWAACAAWIATLATGLGVWLRRGPWQLLGCTLIAAVLFNLLFHLDFQFRGSIYLYAAHLHVPLFLLGAGGLVLATRRRLATGYAVALLLAVLFAAVNLPAAWNFATGFDRVDVPCAAPCATGGV